MKAKKILLSFRLKLTSITVLIVALTLGMIYYFVFSSMNKSISDNLIKQSILEAKLFTNKAALSVNHFDDSLANQQLKKLGVISSVDSAAIILPNGSILGHYSKQPTLLSSNFNVDQAFIKTQQNLIIVEPILEANKLVGHFYIKYDLKTLFKQQSDNLNKLAYILGGIILLTLMLAKPIQKTLTQPIIKMVETISHIFQSGNFDKRLTPSGADEFELLAKEFNHILTTVQNREKELTVRGKQLQRLLEVRTEQLYQKAHFDSLTQLPNRYLLVDRLHQAIFKSTRSKANIALLFLDLDRFKVINDNLGHQNGDLLLKEVAKRLLKIAREGDTVARLGGDEFILLLENLSAPEDAAKTAKRIISSFSAPFQLQKHILHISTSIGISIYPDDGKNDKILLKNADISMYHAKEKGPGNYSFYNKRMNEYSLKRLAIESNLRTAIENNELYLVFQPQLSVKENNYKNAEALLRWDSPSLGNVSPGLFIPIAEETGVVNKIDLWVISQSCEQIKRWNDQGLKDITVAINVSAGHLISETLLKHLKEEIIINQISPKNIEIEITEAVFVENSEQTIKTLQALKRLGTKIAIDDFGTGYSSLQYIQNFPADTLKLDGMFVQNLTTKKSSRGIVRSTIILAHSLGLQLVAEGVETQEQFEFLQKHQCDLIQGYLFSKPLKPEQAFKFFKEKN